MPSGMWDGWLAQLSAEGKGGKAAELPAIVRGRAYAVTINFAGDLSADAFASSLRLSPDAPDPVLETFSVAVGGYANGVTPVTLSLTDLQTGSSSNLPNDADADGLAWMVFDLIHTPSGLASYRLLGGEIPVSGKVS